MSPWHLVRQHFSMIGHALGEEKYHFPSSVGRKMTKEKAAKEATMPALSGKIYISTVLMQRAFAVLPFADLHVSAGNMPEGPIP